MMASWLSSFARSHHLHRIVSLLRRDASCAGVASSSGSSIEARSPGNARRCGSVTRVGAEGGYIRRVRRRVEVMAAMEAAIVSEPADASPNLEAVAPRRNRLVNGHP